MAGARGSTMAATSRMSGEEWRSATSLASIVGLRMLGLFLIVPVFAVHAKTMPGGDSAFLVGLALGIYGLTQGLLQIPFGMASDRFGRKRVIVIGLALFAAGSFIAAVATDIHVAILGRALQGAGAISGAVGAFLADLTREEHRTKAMAMIGASVGLTFALSLAVAPALYQAIGMDGIFVLTGVLAIVGMLVVWKVVPAERVHVHDPAREVRPATLGDVLRHPELARLNVGIFALHAMQIALFLVVPLALVEEAGIAVGDHWRVYLPVVLVSFALMVPPILLGERKGRVRLVFLAAVALVFLVQVGFLALAHGLWSIAALLLVFFVAFNVLEAMLPSLIASLAPASARGTALGVYNTLLSLGLFVGGGVGGLLMQLYGKTGVFVFGMALVALWFVVALPMRPPARRARAAAANVQAP